MPVSQQWRMLYHVLESAWQQQDDAHAVLDAITMPTPTPGGESPCSLAADLAVAQQQAKQAREAIASLKARTYAAMCEAQRLETMH